MSTVRESEVRESANWSALEALPFGTVNGERISLARALRLLKLDLSDRPALRGEWARVIVERIVVQQAGREWGLAPDPEGVRALMAAYRRARNLLSARHTEQFLSLLGLSPDDFYEAMELQWVEEAVRRRVAEEPAEDYFRQHVALYDSAVLSELVVRDEDLAAELALQITEEGAEFASLARRYSIAESRSQAGFLGAVRRDQLSGVQSAAVFAAEADALVGPFPHERSYRLLRVHEVRRAVLTDAARREIEERLWSEWLERRVSAAEPEITVLRHL